MTDWREFFRNIAAETKTEVRFFNPATEVELQRVKDVLGVPVPDTLAELLRQTNGISGEILYVEYVVGSCAEIIEIYQEYEEWWAHTDPLPPGKYFLFGRDGMGDYFGFAVENGVVSSEKIGAFCLPEKEFHFAADNLKEWATELYNRTLTY